MAFSTKKKIILGLVAAAAIAAPLALAAPANAAVAYDAQSVGTVSKGDVQTALSVNDPTLQDAWKTATSSSPACTRWTPTPAGPARTAA